MTETDFRTIADALAADIGAGRLKPGTRLPPQRNFAYERGIAVSTASRVYAELIRRGLAIGEVGRGTFVRGRTAASSPALAEPAPARVDLELNFPILAGQESELAASLASLLRPDSLAFALRAIGAAGTAQARETGASLLAAPGWQPGPDNILFAGNGRQAIAASLAALAPPGERIGVEAMTYPIVKSIAGRLGITLIPLPLDGEGATPEGIEKAHRRTPLSGLYLQPTLHNPLGVTMGPGRRAEIAALLERTGIVAVEDTVYSFLADEQPLAALAPGHTIQIDSLSKRIAPGLTLGFIAAPPALQASLAVAIRSGTWAPTPFALAAGRQLIADGTVARISAAKRKDAAMRHLVAREALAGLKVRSDPRAYHLWLELPDAWRADPFAAAAARQGIAVTPGSAFAVSAGYSGNAVRLALASPPQDVLIRALQSLRKLALTAPEDIAVE